MTVSMRERVFRFIPRSSEDLDARIAAVEKQEGIVFPQAYREVIREIDGRRPNHKDLLEIAEDRFIEVFLTFHSPDAFTGSAAEAVKVNSVPWLLALTKEQVGSGLVPFARDIGGSRWCFDYRRGKSPPSIAWLDGEFDLEIHDAFESFEEFIRHLENAMDAPQAMTDGRD